MNEQAKFPSFRKVEIDDIQLLRYWRNDEKIREMMINHSSISRDCQRVWFESISCKKVQHFIFSFGDEDVGSFSINVINPIDQIFEAGLLCGNQKFSGHWVNIWATIKIYELAFFEYDMKTAIARILNVNKKAISLNEKIGYEPSSDRNSEYCKYVLSRDNFSSSVGKIKRMLDFYILSN